MTTSGAVTTLVRNIAAESSSGNKPEEINHSFAWLTVTIRAMFLRLTSAIARS